MTFAEAIEYLGGARRFGMKLGLEGMRALAGRMGDPQRQLRFIHLAGSNGKGSTAAFCESCLRAAGQRVGLYTSPHLVSIRERIQTDRVPISKQDFAEGMSAVREAAAGEETFFELMTALALWHFARAKVDWVVWETGLGGRLDATNIVSPEVCIITTISLEHTQYLGPTLADIAREKAGIVKPGVPLVSGVAEREAAEVIAASCRSAGARLDLMAETMRPENLGFREGGQRARIAGSVYALGLMGAHQVQNAACAVAALRLLPDAPGDEAIEQGLGGTSWPGRFQIIAESPPTVLDGAHNTAAMEELLKTWREFLEQRGLDPARTHLLFGSVADKDVSEMAALLRPHVARVSTVRLRNERSADPAHLAAAFSGLPCEVLNAVEDFRPDGSLPVLATGSLFLVGEMLARQSGRLKDLQLNERLERTQAAS